MTTGYGTTPDGKRHCYDCCSATERASMIETGKATLYLVERDGKQLLTDWPGNLTFKPWRISKGWHNMAGNRYDVWFNGPDGFVATASRADYVEQLADGEY